MHLPRFKIVACYVAGFAVLIDGPAMADDAAAQSAATGAPIATQKERDTLTGDWGGARTRLADSGINFRGDYVSESFAAVDGGLRRGSAYTQQVRLGADFDMDRIAGWSGGIFHLTFNDRWGKGTSSDFVGNRLPIQEAYGGQYARLSEFSIEQNIAGGRLNLRAGYFAMGNDLGGMPLGCNFVNAAFCAHPLSLSGDSGWYNYPNARWGIAVRYKLRPDLLIRTGVYQVNPSLNNRENAFNPFARGTSGALLPLELEYDPGSARVLPGHYKIGIYYDTSRVMRQGETGTVKGRYGVYLLADQMILREGHGGRGLSLFGQFTANPEASAQITHWYAGGLVKTGTFSGRDTDTIALGVSHASINPHLLKAYIEAAPPGGGFAALPEGETVIELSYGLQIRRWFSIRPDVQYIIDPGAFSYRTTRNALAFGGQIKTQF